MSPRPRLCLMEISHRLTVLTHSVLRGAWINARAMSDKLELSVIAHSATWVSNSRVTFQHHQEKS